MKKILLRNILKLPVLLAIVAAFVSCTSDLPLPQTSAPGGAADDCIRFSVVPPASSEVEMMSRATVPATDPEKKIYTLRIMVFDGDGNLIPDDVFRFFDNSFKATVFGTENLDAAGNMIENPEPFDGNEGFSIPVFDRHVYYSVTTTTTTADDGKVSTSQTVGYLGDTEPADYNTPPEGTRYYHLDPSEDGNLKNCQIWALANMGRWKNSLVNHIDEGISSLDDVKTLDQLRRFYGKRIPENFAENRPFLPMVGTIRGDTDVPVLDYLDNSRIIERNDGTYLTFSDIFGEGAATTAPTGYDYAEPSYLDLTSPTAVGSPNKIFMDQIVAKVRFNITMPAVQTSTTEGDLKITDDAGEEHNVQSLKWEFYFDNWTVENLPRYTYIIPHLKDIADYVSNDTYSQAAFGVNPAENRFLVNGLYMPDEDKGDEPAAFEHNGFGDGEMEGDWIGPGKSSPNATAAADTQEGSFIYEPTEGQYYYHFYTYGNRRGGPGEAKKENLSGTNYSENYYDGLSADASGEFYKTLYAPQGATFLVLRGIVRRTYVDMSGVTNTESRSVCYKIALGRNRTDDYNVCRNTCYTLHITINGFDQNDLQVTEGNYNSSVHRRFQMAVRAPYLDQFDCHYDMRYVQFTGISDSKQQRDVRLRIYGSEADARAENTSTDGTVVEGYGNDNHGSSAVSWLKIGEYDPTSGHDYGTLTNIEIDQEDIFADGNEKTFCIHAEEYVGSGGTTPTENRKAWLQIRQTYHGLSNVLESLSDVDKHVGGDYLGVAQRTLTADDGTEETVYDVYFLYPIEQYPPIEVTYQYYDSNGQEQSNTLLVERFEEYAMSLDPGINQPKADGLQWGWSRYNDSSSDSGYGFYEFTPKDKPKDDTTPQNSDDDGFFNTPVIATLTQNANDKANNFTRYSYYRDFAARYCYDKGIEGNRSWYLPSITELNGLTSAERLKGDMNTYQSGDGVGTEDGPIYWSSTTYTDPDDYPDVLKAYWITYHDGNTSYSSGFRTYYGWDAAWRKSSTMYFWAGSDRVTYNTVLGMWAGAPYDVNYLREVWNYMEAMNDKTSEQYPFNCAVASCNGLRYLIGYSRVWNADNSEVDNALLPPRSTTYRVRAVRKKPQ